MTVEHESRHKFTTNNQVKNQQKLLAAERTASKLIKKLVQKVLAVQNASKGDLKARHMAFLYNSEGKLKDCPRLIVSL